MAKYRSPKKQKNKSLSAACIILGVFLALLCAAYAFFRNYYGLSNYVSDSEAAAKAQQARASLDADTLSQIEKTGLTDSEEQALKSAQNTSGIDLYHSSSIYNLLLIGVDRRDASWNGNSDSMILLSINNKTKKIHMMSLMRDMYADIEGYGVRKLNAACAIGGPTLLVSTIESNYKIDIDNYACVDFVSMANIIDAVGGVEITVSDAEAEMANGLITDMCGLAGVDPGPHLYSGAGTWNADGWMAVGYARIRHIGNADYQRTERQRTVLTGMMSKIRSMSTTELNSFVREVLPYVTHNITSSTMLQLVASVPSYLSYDVEQSRVPFDNLYTSQGEILVPTQPDTIDKIQEILNS